MDTSNIVNSIQLHEKGPMYMHPDSDFSYRPPISSREQLREMYPECFGGIGTFKNCKYHIEIDKSVRPVVHGVRKVALALIPRLDQALDKMEKDGIIVKVNRPTDWVNSLVVREKPNGSLRVCLDPKDLNKLDDESSYLTTFNTHRGRYRYKHLSYILNCS